MKKFNKIWMIVGLCLAAALLIGGVVLIICGIKIPEVEDVEDFVGKASQDVTYFVAGGFLIFAGIGVGSITIYLGIGHKTYTTFKETMNTLSEKVNESQDEYCPYCGAKIELGETKCSNCGASVK